MSTFPPALKVLARAFPAYYGISGARGAADNGRLAGDRARRLRAHRVRRGHLAGLGRRVPAGAGGGPGDGHAGELLSLPGVELDGELVEHLDDGSIRTAGSAACRKRNVGSRLNSAATGKKLRTAEGMRARGSDQQAAEQLAIFCLASLGSSSVRDLSICRTKPAYMVVGTADGVFVSDDAGRNWRRVGRDVPGLRNVKSVAIHPRDPRFLFGGTWRLPYRSNDFGKTWTRMEQGIYFDSDVFSITVDVQNPEILFAGACSGIYRSVNRGQSWTRLRVVPDRFTVRTHVVYIDPFNSHSVYAGTTEGLFASRDRGQTWKRLTSKSLTVNAIQIDPKNNRKIAIATDDQGVLRSDDGGRDLEGV